MTLSEKIRTAREEANLTQQELAEAIGVSRRAVVSYECAGVRPRFSTLRRMVRVLHVSYDYLQRDDITDPRYGMDKLGYVEQVRDSCGRDAASELNDLLERNRALFAGGELSEESKDDFYMAVTKAYLLCKEEARRTYGRGKRSSAADKQPEN